MAAGRAYKVLKGGCDRANLQPCQHQQRLLKPWTEWGHPSRSSYESNHVREWAEEVLSQALACLHGQQKTPPLACQRHAFKPKIYPNVHPVLMSHMCVSCYLAASTAHLKIEIWQVVYIRAHIYIFFSPSLSTHFPKSGYAVTSSQAVFEQHNKQGLKYVYAVRFAGLFVCLERAHSALDPEENHVWYLAVPIDWETQERNQGLLLAVWQGDLGFVLQHGILEPPLTYSILC